MSAKVYLVGAGPGDPELLTLKAVRLLAAANVVLHDALVSEGVLALISPAAEVINVGKRAGQKLLTQDEINSLLVSCAGAHQTVVRLKGGDPTVFGRAGEEIEALRKAGVAWEIVPGISAALGAAAAAGISLTDRRVASQILFTTFSRGSDGSVMDWGCVTSTTTLVLYMPGADYVEVSERLLAGAAGGPSLRGRLSRQWFRAAIALVERWAACQRRKAPGSRVVDRRACGVTGRRGN